MRGSGRPVKKRCVPSPLQASGALRRSSPCRTTRRRPLCRRPPSSSPSPSRRRRPRPRRPTRRRRRPTTRRRPHRGSSRPPSSRRCATSSLRTATTKRGPPSLPVRGGEVLQSHLLVGDQSRFSLVLVCQTTAMSRGGGGGWWPAGLLADAFESEPSPCLVASCPRASCSHHKQERGTERVCVCLGARHSGNTTEA